MFGVGSLSRNHAYLLAYLVSQVLSLEHVAAWSQTVRGAATDLLVGLAESSEDQLAAGSVGESVVD